MELLFQIIIILGFIKYSCKATFFSGWKGILFYALFAGLIALLFYPIIITINTNTVDKLLVDKLAVSNIAVIITIEAISRIMINIGMLSNLFELKKKKWVRVLKLIPGILIFGIVFYIELSVFKYMAGIDFLLVAFLTASLFIVGVSVVSLVFKKLLPSITARYELEFLVNILLLLFVILLNSGVANYNSSNYSANIEYVKLFAFIGIVIFGFVGGFVLHRNKYNLKKIFKIK